MTDKQENRAKALGCGIQLFEILKGSKMTFTVDGKEVSPDKMKENSGGVKILTDPIVTIAKEFETFITGSSD
jgi:hypothetical protein